MNKFLLGTALAFAMPVAAVAAPVDLTGWIENGLEGNNGAGTWTVGSGNDNVYQSTNGFPTVFFKPGENSQGNALKGTIKVETTGDNDFIGFVLGYQDGEMNITSADFWLIDWKQADQNIGGADGLGEKGLALSHISGDIKNNPGPYNGMWGHTGVVNEVVRGSNLGSTGWADNTTYSFELVFTSTLIEVSVNGVKEISYTSAQHGSLFTDGSFGFYNNSQDDVRYAGITEDVIPDPNVVPLPASAPLLLAGFGAFAAMRRRRKG